MTQDVRRELRLLSIVAALLAAYVAVVGAYAAANGQIGLLLAPKVGEVMASIWVVALGCVFGAYLIDLVVRRRPARPLQVLAAELRAELLRPDLLLARGTIVLGFFVLIVVFTPFKIMIGHTRGFPYDAALRGLDRALFAGHDPWQVTHALFGGAPATLLLNSVYSLWFVMMWLSVIYFVLRPGFTALRARWTIAFLLCWIIVGSAGAYFLASAGPCYTERVFGDPYFRPLMARLAAIDHAFGSGGSGFGGVTALRVQDMLWNSHAAKRELFGGGISAMPSMHVSISVLLACTAWQAGRRAGALLTVFALLIWIGSIHLGWHYALDGVVALGLTLGIWKASGWLVDRYVMREAPAAAWRPALAE